MSHDDMEAFGTYEEYLESQISETDMYYLKDEDLARQLVELGYHGTGETLKREEFDARKKAERERHTQKTNVPRQLASAGKEFDAETQPFLLALAQREELVRNGKLTTILFVRDKNAKGQEVSGYIDFAHRMKSEAFEPYFDMRKRLMPRSSDLSYFNWGTQKITCNPTPNFQVIADSETGLLFKNKRDRKVINVDPKAASPGDNTTRTEIKTPEYMQVVIYDHRTRRKT
jgi:hypothetical protein